MSCFIITRAIIVRLLFALHGLVTICLLFYATWTPSYWYLTVALGGLFLETIITLVKKRGQEWKWFCPSVFFYLLSVVPAIWFLELLLIDVRRASSPSHIILLNLSLSTGGNSTPRISHNGEDISNVPKIYMLKNDIEWYTRVLEQILLLLLIMGRWILPKGKLSHDQLSQLLLVYIGTAADIVEFFEAFKEDTVSHNRTLGILVLSIWTWSLLQFSLVLTASKAKKEPTRPLMGKGGLHASGGGSSLDTLTLRPKRQWCKCCSNCFSADVFGIIMSILLQDLPFLGLRLALIFNYQVFSYTNCFFTSKNSLVISLLLYRLFVIYLESYREKQEVKREELQRAHQIRLRLMTNEAMFNHNHRNSSLHDTMASRHTAGGSLNEEILSCIGGDCSVRESTAGIPPYAMTKTLIDLETGLVIHTRPPSSCSGVYANRNSTQTLPLLGNNNTTYNSQYLSINNNDYTSSLSRRPTPEPLLSSERKEPEGGEAGPVYGKTLPNRPRTPLFYTHEDMVKAWREVDKMCQEATQFLEVAQRKRTSSRESTGSTGDPNDSSSETLINAMRRDDEADGITSRRGNTRSNENIPDDDSSLINAKS